MKIITVKIEIKLKYYIFFYVGNGNIGPLDQCVKTILGQHEATRVITKC